MFYVSKRMEIAACHKLDLDRESKCNNSHGHNWIITLHCRAECLNEEDMVVDFSVIKKQIHDKLDHSNLNKSLGGCRPTAERIAEWCVKRIPFAWKCEVQESEGNTAVYEEEE